MLKLVDHYRAIEPIKPIQAHAWQHREDLEELDWQAMCKDYPLADVLGSGRNVSHKFNRARFWRQLRNFAWMVALFSLCWGLFFLLVYAGITAFEIVKAAPIWR
jgi:hypothetical protein